MLLDRLEDQPQDSLIALIALAEADHRPDKIDVGVGVYRDAAGNTPILRAVKAAERRLVETQVDQILYRLAGRRPLHRADQADRVRRRASPRTTAIVGLQTPGGCGALRLGAELVAKANPQRAHLRRRADLAQPRAADRLGRRRDGRLPLLRQGKPDDLLRADDGRAGRGRGGRSRPAPRLLPQSDRRRPRHGAMAGGRRHRSPSAA